MFVIIVYLLIQSVRAENFFATESFFPKNEVEVLSPQSLEIMGRIENFPNRNEPVRKFLKSYNSLRPVGIVVDDTKESLNLAAEFINNIFTATTSVKQVTFYVIKFNSSGTTPINEIAGRDTEQLYDSLTYKANQQNLELGFTQPNGTLAFFATLQVASVLPTDTAIIIFIDRKINDEDLARHAAIVRKKNIKVYVLWGGPYPTKNGEERLLKELCSYSGGLFIVNGIKDLSGYNYRKYLHTNNQDLNTSILFSKSNLTEDTTFTFPVDSEVADIHIILTPTNVEGTLTTPKGEHLQIGDTDGIASYGTGSFEFTERGHREVFLDATQGVGEWNFHVKASATSSPCDVKVYIRTKLTAQAYFVRRDPGLNYDKNKPKILKLDFTGRLGNIKNISFISNDGQFPLNNISYAIVKGSVDVEKHKRKEVDIEVIGAPENPFQVRVNGTDENGNIFSRLTYINDNKFSNAFPQPILLIDVAVGSELIITAGGKTSVVIFEVTNLQDTAADTRFYCKDEKSILGSMQPYRSIISPRETVAVTLIISSTVGTYQNLITFTAAVGSDVIEKKVIVNIGSQIVDNEAPTLAYTYLGDCSKVIFSSCDQGTWTIEAKARDQVSGLLQLTSQPRGLYIQNGFTSGTTDEVTGTYSDSCCNADIQLTAIDRLNNRRTIKANAYRAMWGPGQIAALVLGLLFFILIVIIAIYFIVRCIRKKKEYDLPTYRGGGV